MSVDIIHGDRRADRRYQHLLEMRFSYRHDGAVGEGSGCTVDLSRGGVRFETDTPPPPGAEIALRVAWPFLLQNVCPLELHLSGRVLRNDDDGTVVVIRKYEFRTCGSRSFEQQESAAPFVSFVA